MDLKVPPQNLEAEKAVIGSILIDSDSINKVIDLLRADFFYDPRHALIFQTVSALYAAGKAIDVLTLTDELKKVKKLKQSGGVTYLSEVVSSVPTSSNIKDYAEIVREKALRRSLISYGAKLGDEARVEDKSIDSILDELETNLLGLTRDTMATDFFDASTLIEMQMERADEYAKNPGSLRGLATGMRDLDKILGGLHKSDLIILAARPSVGKSAFIVDIARHAAVNEKKAIAIFSLEMPAVQIIERMLAQQLRVNLWNLRMGKLTDQDFKKYSEGAGKLSEANIKIDETAGLSIMQLRSKARKLALEGGIDLIVVDYLQLMQTREIDNRAQAVGELSRSLKILARELNVPIIVISQLNRAVENRTDRTPQLSDLRESGSIEQDADIVMFLSKEVMNEDIDTSSPDRIDKIDVTIAKHRNGAVGKFSLQFQGSHQKFMDITKD